MWLKNLSVKNPTGKRGRLRYCTIRVQVSILLFPSFCSLVIVIHIICYYDYCYFYSLRYSRAAGARKTRARTCFTTDYNKIRRTPYNFTTALVQDCV